MDFSYVHIRYFIGYVYHICLQDTIQSTLSLCLLCQAMLLLMALRPLLLTTRSGFSARCFVSSTLEGTSYVSEDFSFLSFSVLYALPFLIAQILLELFS